MIRQCGAGAVRTGRRYFQNLAGSKTFPTSQTNGLQLNPLQSARFVPFPVTEHSPLGTSSFFSKTRVLSTSAANPKAANPKTEKPQTLEDFQHEEITGPTVERDVSATANELRESIDAMLAYNGKLKRALAAVGCTQLAVGLWMAGTNNASGSLFLFYTGLSAGVTLQLAYVFHQTLKPLPFFQRVEERSRLRVLTLSLQCIKAATNLFSRSNVVARYTMVGLSGAFAYEVAPWIIKLAGFYIEYLKLRL